MKSTVNGTTSCLKLEGVCVDMCIRTYNYYLIRAYRSYKSEGKIQTIKIIATDGRCDESSATRQFSDLRLSSTNYINQITILRAANDNQFPRLFQTIKTTFSP